MGSPKMLDKSIRQAMRMPAPPKNPYVALMVPMVIVPESPEDKVVVADAGTIVRLMDQSTLYRHWHSPVTRRSDELLVQYGKPDQPKMGWLTNKLPTKSMKPSTGPTFLVTTRSEDGLVAWERFRLKIAAARKKHPDIWLVPWLVQHGPKHPAELKEVMRFFGGKPIKNEGFDARCSRLFTLILYTEIDMASAKKSSKKTTKKSKQKESDEPVATKKTSKKSAKKASKSSKKASAVSSDRVTKSQDEYVIKRLVKENPRRPGSAKAKIWDKLKKGMTVGEFVQKGGSRASVGRYVQNGWVKLIAP